MLRAFSDTTKRTPEDGTEGEKPKDMKSDHTFQLMGQRGNYAVNFFDHRFLFEIIIYTILGQTRARVHHFIQHCNDFIESRNTDMACVCTTANESNLHETNFEKYNLMS
jgi:hypothetical protein